MNTFMWLLKREYWEHRGGFKWAPLIAAAVVLLVSTIAALTGLSVAHEHHVIWNGIKLDEITAAMTPEVRAQVGTAIDIALYMSAMPIAITLAIVSFFYLVGCLYDDRRDRSVLFWKSLPVSDLETVLSKVTSAIVVAPLIAVAAALALMFGVLLLISVIAMIHGASPFLVWQLASPLRVAGKLLLVLPINALWAMPTIGWLMVCSAWARRVPLLWAILVPVAAGTSMSIFDAVNNLHIPDAWFWKNIVSRALFSTMPGGWLDLEHFNQLENADGPADVLKAVNMTGISQVLISPNLWAGVVVGVVLIIAAIWLRRWRDDS